MTGQSTLSITRLKKRRDFLRAAKGRYKARKGVVVQICSTPEDQCMDGVLGLRIGFTASKKVGGAVVRNRCKRRLREAARLLLPLHGRAHHDYVFIARAATAERDWRLLLDDVKSALISLTPSNTSDRTEHL